MTRITGPELISFVDDLTAQGKTRSEICRAAGYTSIKENGTERLHFTDFYTELLDAKGGPEALNNEEDEYYYTHPEVVGYYDSEADFAEKWYEDLDIPVQIVVDWQATWDTNLRHHFYFMNGYVFRNCI